MSFASSKLKKNNLLTSEAGFSYTKRVELCQIQTKRNQILITKLTIEKLSLMKGDTVHSLVS